jgi:hypothetical protein
MFASITPRPQGLTRAMIVWGMACVVVMLAAVMFITAFPAR